MKTLFVFAIVIVVFIAVVVVVVGIVIVVVLDVGSTLTFLQLGPFQRVRGEWVVDVAVCVLWETDRERESIYYAHCCIS